MLKTSLFRPLLTPLALALATLAANAQTAVSTTTSADTRSVDGTLPPVEVVGRRQSGGYDAAEVSGTKTTLPLRELPQSLRVMSRQAIDDLGAVRVDDVLDYVGGVSRQNNFGGLWDNIAIRGLAGNENTGMATLLNGFAGNRGFNAPRDTADIERIEFLKGPAAALYGSSEPGGTLNIVTKKPQWQRATAVEFYAGSYQFYRGALDTTGPIGEHFAYRLNAAVEDRNTFRDHVGVHRDVLAPAFTWKLGNATTLDYTGQWIRHRTPLDRGVVAVNSQLGAVARERFLGEPADGDVTVDNQTHQLVLEHEFNADLQARVGVSTKTGTFRGFSTEATAVQADGRTLRRQRRYRDYGSDDLQVQAELLGKARTGGIVHEWLAGLEASHYTLDERMLRINPTAAAPYAIDILSPVYGQPQPTPGPSVDNYTEQRNSALVLQDALLLSPQWRLIGGLRVDRSRQSLLNRRTTTLTAQSPTETSPRLGLSYLPTKQWTLYANAGKSFRPNPGATAAGVAFEPEHGTALEVGAKWESLDRRLGATLAVFDIRKRNALTGDPANSGFSIAAGELRSRGAEFDIAGQLSTEWRLTGSLAYNDVKVTKDQSLQVDGRVLNVPRYNGSVLAVYENALAGSGRYGLGGGVTHMGQRLGQAYTQAEANAGTPAFNLPAYTTAKLVAYWRLNPTLRVSLDVDNLFDRTYYSSSYSRVWVTPGSARTVTAGVQAKF